MSVPSQEQPATLTDVASVFLKLGIVAFGGPAAHVALMRRELVQKHRWIEEKRFLQMFAACNLIPGPSSTELAIYIGYRLLGITGLVLAGTLFILPAALIMLGLAVLYVHYGSTHTAADILNGIRPVVVSIIIWALLDLGRRILRRIVFLAFAALIFGLALAGWNPVGLLAIAAALGVLSEVASRPRKPTEVPAAKRALFVPAFKLSLVAPAAAVLTNTDRLPTLFLTFLKLGAVSFGSGYVLFAFLHADFVSGLHWISDRQLTDAVAIGQATPGPVFTTATFLGYLFSGYAGAVLATIAIFLPGFCLVPFLDRVITLVERHRVAQAFLDGVNVGAMGLIAGVLTVLARSSIHDPFTALLAVAALPIIFWRPLASPAVILGAALLGLAVGT